MKNNPLALLFLILVLALGLRLSAITFDSFWLDEGYQSMVDAHGQTLPDFTRVSTKPYLFHLTELNSADKVLANFKKVDPLCPPLYALILNFWMKACGQSDFSIRLLSALLSTAGTFFIYFFANKFCGRKAALWSAFVCAISPFDIYYGQEARMYSLSVLLSTLSCGSFILLCAGIKQKQREFFYLVAYTLSTCCLINTHYTNLFVVFFQGLYGLVFCFSQKRFKLLAILSIAWLSVLLLWQPWFDIFRHAAGIRTNAFYVARKASLLWPIMALFVKIPLNWIGFLSGKRVAIFAIPLYLTSALLLANAFRAAKTIIKAPEKTDTTFDPDTAPNQTTASQATLAVCLWLVLPALLLWFVDVIENHRVVEITRYVIATSPACYMLVGLGLANYFQTSIFTRLLLACHVLFALTNNAWMHLVPQREPWRQIADVVSKSVGADDMVFVSQYYDIVLLDRYLTKPLKQIGISPAMGDAQIKQVVSPYARFWLLTAGDGDAATTSMPANYHIIKQIHLAHGLHLRLYEQNSAR